MPTRTNNHQTAWPPSTWTRKRSRPSHFALGPVRDEESIAAIRHAVDLGVNWVSTAPIFGLGHAEEVVGRALAGYALGEDVFVATKCGRRRRARRPRHERSSPGHDPIGVRAQPAPSWCGEASTSSRSTGPTWTPELRSRTRGLCFRPSSTKARFAGWGYPTSTSISSSAASGSVTSTRSSLRSPSCGRARSARPSVGRWSTARASLPTHQWHRGCFRGRSDKARLAGLPPDDVRRQKGEFAETELSSNLALVERLRLLAGDLGVDVASLAIAWVLAQQGVTAAIVGARRPEQIDQWLGAARLTLSTDVLDAIDEAVAETGAGTDDPPALPAAVSSPGVAMRWAGREPERSGREWARRVIRRGRHG